MASKSSKDADGWTGRRVDFAAYGEEIAKRRAALGIGDLQRNSGKRRTESKKALLKAIEAAGGKW